MRPIPGPAAAFTAHGSRVEPTMTGPPLRTTLAIVLAAILQPAAARAQADATDWPTYNHDVLGSRYNRGEKAIGRDNAGRLEEKWRVPPKGSGPGSGGLHAPPPVGGGHVFLRQAPAPPRVFHMTPHGRGPSCHPHPEIGRGPARPGAGRDDVEAQTLRLRQSSDGGIFGSALVNQDTVFYVDLEGWIYALDRATGKERWKLSMRGKEFPGAHPLNISFA